MIEEVQRRGGEAKEKGVMLMSAVGFDCVPGGGGLVGCCRLIARQQ